MRTILVAALLLSTTLLALAPTAAACPTTGCTFGHCDIVWTPVGEYKDPVSGQWKSLDSPQLRCVW